MTTIEIPIRELHARTGHYVRLASRNTEVIITEHGKPAARIAPLTGLAGNSEPLGKRRTLIGSYREALASGRLSSDKDSTPELRETSAIRNL